MFLGLGSPTFREGSSEQWLEIADGEEHISFQPKPSAGKDHVAEIVANWRHWILLNHCPDIRKLTFALGGVDACDEANALSDGKIGPVHTIARVAVIGLQQIVEDLLLV